MGFEYGSMGDLPDDLIGSILSPDAKTDRGNLVSNDLITSWSERKEGKLELIDNDIRLLGISDDKEKRERSKRDRTDSIKHAKRMMTAGKSFEEIRQCLAASFSADQLSNDPEIASLAGEIGLLGRVYIDRSAYDTCDKMRDHLRESRNKIPELLLKNADCDACQKQMNGLNICPKAGLRLASTIEYSPDFCTRVQNRFAAYGLIAPGQPIKTRDDIKAVMFGRKPAISRDYFTPPKIKKPNIPIDDALRKIADEAAKKRERQSAGIQRAEIMRTSMPVLRQVYAYMAKGLDGDVLNAQMKQSFTKDVLSSCNHYISEMINDPRVAAGLIYYPGFFNNCASAKEFAVTNKIAAPYAIAIDKCADCVQNLTGCCNKLGMKILKCGEKIPQEDIALRIDNLNAKRKISSSDASKFKKMEKEAYLSGLRAAIGQCRSHPATTSSIPSTKPAPILSAAKHVNHQAAYDWALKQLQSRSSVSEIKNQLSKTGSASEAEMVAAEALYSLPSIGAGVLDQCTQTSYALRQGAVLERSGKCHGCPYERDAGCAKQRVPFVDTWATDLLSGVEASESREIKEFFGNTEMPVEVDAPRKAKPQLDIQDFGQDEGMILSPCKPFPKDTDPECRKIFDGSGSLQDIDVPPGLEQPQPLEIDDLDGSMNLTDL